MRVNERFAPAAAAVSALAALVCCLPLGIAGGIGALGLVAVAGSLQPWLLGASAILLGTGIVQLYRGQKSCQRRSRVSVVLLGLSAVIVVGVIVFPQVIAVLMAALP